MTQFVSSAFFELVILLPLMVPNSLPIAYLQNDESNWIIIELASENEHVPDIAGTMLSLSTNDGYTHQQQIDAAIISNNQAAIRFELSQALPEQLRVTWPNGHTQILVDIPLNQSWRIVYDDTPPSLWERISGFGAIAIAFLLIILLTAWRQSTVDLSKIVTWSK
ncbi:MAG: hypothetical protein AAF485_15705 [Chloroflexota bacterium]